MANQGPEEQPVQEQQQKQQSQEQPLQEQQLQEQQLQEAQEVAQYLAKLKGIVQLEDVDAEGSSILEESYDDKDKEVKEGAETKQQPQQLHQEPQVPQEQNPQVSSGQVADASAAAASSSTAQLQQQYQQYYRVAAAAAGGQDPRLFWGCAIHGTRGLRCMACDIEYWRHYLFFVSGYRYHGRVPPPPIPIFPMPLHRPSFQGMPPNFPGGFGFGQQGGGGGGGGGGGNDGNWGNPHGAKRPRPE
ncbi:hypothetical protein V8C34DRAFT_80972 [Trichoderma compactum]